MILVDEGSSTKMQITASLGNGEGTMADDVPGARLPFSIPLL